jgi:hypothetical protein
VSFISQINQQVNIKIEVPSPFCKIKALIFLTEEHSVQLPNQNFSAYVVPCFIIWPSFPLSPALNYSLKTFKGQDKM